MGGVELSQSCRSTIRTSFTFNHQVPSTHLISLGRMESWINFGVPSGFEPRIPGVGTTGLFFGRVASPRVFMQIMPSRNIQIKPKRGKHALNWHHWIGASLCVLTFHINFATSEEFFYLRDKVATRGIFVKRYCSS